MPDRLPRVPRSPVVIPYISLMLDLAEIRERAGTADEPAFIGSGWYPPKEVALEGDVLHFSPDLDRTRLLVPRRGLLTSFVALQSAPAASVAAFARRWGRLFLCEHGLPESHHMRVPLAKGPPMIYSPEPELPWEAIPMGPQGWGDLEPLANWRFLAGRMAAILEAASSLYLGSIPSLEIWDRAGGPPLRRYVELFSRAAPDMRKKLALSLTNLHMDIAAPRLQVGPAGMVVAGALPVALAVQLALAVARQESDFLPCSTPGCTNPAILPRRGATAYCGGCLADGARNRDSQWRHREKLRLERQRGDMSALMTDRPPTPSPGS